MTGIINTEYQNWMMNVSKDGDMYTIDVSFIVDGKAVQVFYKGKLFLYEEQDSGTKSQVRFTCDEIQLISKNEWAISSLINLVKRQSLKRLTSERNQKGGKKFVKKILHFGFFLIFAI